MRDDLDTVVSLGVNSMNDKKRAALDTLIDKVKHAYELLENMDHDTLAMLILDSPSIREYYATKKKAMSVCIYCGMAIEHPEDPEKIAEIHHALVKHDARCPQNPFVFALKQVRQIAKDGRDWNPGHFCESRSKMQSIVDRCDNVLRD